MTTQGGNGITVQAHGVMDREAQLFLQPFRRQPVVLVRGSGVRVWDDTGREYLDFTSGLGVNILGHCHPVVIEAVQQQLSQLIHATNAFYTVPQVELAELLVEHSPLDRVFFTNSGAESNECAIKLVRKWGTVKRGGAYEIITSTTGFHGRTLGALAATGYSQLQAEFGPMPPGFRHVPFNDLSAIEAEISERTVAVMLEPIQGQRGVYPGTLEYIRGVRELCDRYGLLLVLDEIQSGMGRTGTLWAHTKFGIEPDVMTLAKGLGSGVPIGACLAKDTVCVFAPGDHGSTFGGNPLACAAGRAVLQEVLCRNLPAHAARMGERLGSGLRAMQAEAGCNIREVRTAGLWMAVEFVDDRAQTILAHCRESGVLLNATEDPKAVRLAPPLIVSESECDRFLEEFRSAVRR